MSQPTAAAAAAKSDAVAASDHLSPATTSSAAGNVFMHELPHPVYAMAFSSSSSPSLLAVGSFLETLNNRVDLFRFLPSSSSAGGGGGLIPLPSLSFDHSYPPTKLQFHPSPSSPSPLLLASSSDALRLWSVDPAVGGGTELRAVLDNRKASDFCAPLTSLDWNVVEPRRVGTASIDTTCTVWDVERSAVETQLIAHDKEVLDLAWGEAGVFASVSSDGSLRVFDLRDKEHSTIVYESPRPDTPLLRLAWNHADPRYIATLPMDSATFVVLDIRLPAVPVAELCGHRAGCNAVAWAPHAPRHLASTGDDGQALIWQMPFGSVMAPSEGVDPVLVYDAGAEVNQLQWPTAHPDWIGIALNNKVQVLLV